MTDLPSFDNYLASLGHLTAHVDPTASGPEAVAIRKAAASLVQETNVSITSLSAWVNMHPDSVPVLGLTVGLSLEKLKNTLKHHFDTAGWVTLARRRPRDLIEMLDNQYDLVRLLRVQRNRSYDFGDLLVARARTRGTAARAGLSGRKIEDEIEAIATDLGLPFETRTRFRGRGGRTAPCDLAIPSGSVAAIAVAAKGFDSTGSKLTDAVREILEMAEVRLPRQYIIAVIDGIGWKSRTADLRRIYNLWETEQIDGMYTLASLDVFRRDLESAARLRDLI
ncbi:MAG: hypothetical protein ACRDQG_02165 [Pseudonocardiaceae bacterium]